MISTKKIASVALLTAIGIVMNLVTFPKIQIFGTISLVYAYCYLCGIFLGPWYGALAAGLADILGFLIFPQGVFIPQITMSNALMALFCGFGYHYITSIKKEYVFVLTSLFSFVFLTLGLTSWGLSMYFFEYFKTAQIIGQKLSITSPYVMTVLWRLVTQSFWTVLNMIVAIYVSKRLSFYSNRYFNKQTAGPKLALDNEFNMVKLKIKRF